MNKTRRAVTVPYVLHFAQQSHGDAGLALAAEMMLVVEDVLKNASKRAQGTCRSRTARLALHRIVEARVDMRK